MNELIDIKNFEGLYKADKHGNIYSEYTGQILIPTIRNGYKSVVLYKQGEKFNFLVHRIIAETFLGDTKGKDVHHIDCDRGNNHISNLKIIDSYEHRQFHQRIYPLVTKCVICGNEFNRTTKQASKNVHTCSKECYHNYLRTKQKNIRPVVQKTYSGKVIKVWASVNEIDKKSDFNRIGVWNCCNNKKPQYKGFLWEYQE